MTLATDVPVILGRDLTTAELARVDRSIELATGALEGQLPGLTIGEGSETVDIVWHDPELFWTPRYPVRSVNGLTVAGAPVLSTNYRCNERGRVELASWGSMFGLPSINGPWIAGYARVTVDYEFGFAGSVPPTELGLVISTTVANVFARQSSGGGGDVASETMGNYSISYFERALATTLAADPSLLGNVKGWRRVGVGSIPVHT